MGRVDGFNLWKAAGLRVQSGPEVRMRCYAETDGRIFLVDRDGRLDLPTMDELPFDVVRVAPLPVTAEETWFCIPQIDAHPHTWPSKDDVGGIPEVSSLVREAVHASMPRVVVEGVCLDEEDQVLLVKGSRGLTKGRWTLPGGFLRFGESPEEGLAREVSEEIGVDSEIVDPIAVRAKLGNHTRLHWIMLFYRIRVFGELNPNPDEIAEARYIARSEAVELLDGEMAAVLRDSV